MKTESLMTFSSNQVIIFNLLITLGTLGDKFFIILEGSVSVHLPKDKISQTRKSLRSHRISSVFPNKLKRTIDAKAMIEETRR
jgi:hypothetical protein